LKPEFALRHRLHDGWAIRPVASTQYPARFAVVYAPFCFEPVTNTHLPLPTKWISCRYRWAAFH
ncbi:hypothetical protein ACVGWT_00675, partial [Enterobacter hormaechei]